MPCAEYDLPIIISRRSVMVHSKKREHGTPSVRSITETAPKASLIMLFTGLFVLFVTALFASGTPAPADLSVFLAPAALFLGTTAGGFYCGLRLRGGEGCACAAASSAMLAAVLLLSKLFIAAPKDKLSFTLAVILHLLTVLTAVAGAVIAGRAPKKKRRKKTRNRSKL